MLTLICLTCEVGFLSVRRARKFCSHNCYWTYNTKPPQAHTCEWCGGRFITLHYEKNRRFCGRVCQGRWALSRPELREKLYTEASRQRSQELMLKLRRRPDVQAKIASHLASEGNPFRDPIVRQKSIIAQREKGYAYLNGGNGRDLPLPQRLLAARLGWRTEFVVKTGMQAGSGYPPSYKVDIAEPLLKIGIEVDGWVHELPARREKDAKKEALLTDFGWRILRFINKEVLQDLEAAVLVVMTTVRSTT